jgi:hypothetical protein
LLAQGPQKKTMGLSQLQKPHATITDTCSFVLLFVVMICMIAATRAAPAAPAPTPSPATPQPEQTGLEMDPNSTLAAMWKSVYYQEEVKEDVVVLTVVEEMDEASGVWSRTLRNYTNGTRWV